MGNVTLPTPVFLAGGALCLVAGYLVNHWIGVAGGVVGAVIASLGILAGKFLFIDDLLSGIVSNGVIPPIEV